MVALSGTRDALEARAAPCRSLRSFWYGSESYQGLRY
jgi:hypothetical protein